MSEPDFGGLAWALATRWKSIEPRSAAFYTATEKAARHYGRVIRSPLKSMAALSHNFGLGQCFCRIAVERPLLARGWVAEEVIASVRGYGEKVVDSCVVDSTSTPALAIEFAGASYAASNGQRLKDIHLDSASRRLPYEVWTVQARVGAGRAL
jgi:hypothetical protein